MNGDLYKKSYLLEVFNKKTNKITDAFCFSVPPESEELGYSQRISKTQTFGGLCVDRYGNEAVQITLSGTTVNQEFKYIYRSTLAPQNLNGEGEIYYLRDLLENVAADENAELRLYDLSKSQTAFVMGLANVDLKYINNWWIVHLDNFKIRRAKDRPHTYVYTIEFTGEPKNARKYFKFESLKIKDSVTGATSVVSKIKNSPASLLTKIDNGISKMRIGINALQTIYDDSVKFINQLYVVSDKVEDFEMVFSDYADVIQNFHTLKDKAITTTVKVGENVIKSFNNIGIDIGQSVISTALVVYDATTVLSDMYDELMKIEPSELYSEDKLNELEMSVSELRDVSGSAYYEIIEGVNEIVADLKQSSIPEIITNTDENGDDYAEISYGFEKETIKDGMTLEKLSFEKYGSAEFVAMIENYNGITEDELKPGMEIKLPILNPDNKDFENDIYETENVMGTDINLTEDGDIDVFAKDLGEVTGRENLSQAIELRLSSYMGSNVRDVVYGLRTSVGESPAANSYMLSSMEQTLDDEPRISEITSIRYEGKGDSIYVAVGFTDIQNEQVVYKGVI